LGEYFGIDPTLIRLGFVVGALLTGVGAVLLVYIIMLIVVPEQPLTVETVAANPAI
jgi:phage shock protein PspC (stress-responsive transcriptional regulator)